MEIAVLACGCFWGPEKKFGSLNGVYKTEVGYCGGKTEKTTYQEVCSGNTNHAEVVKINFDPKKPKRLITVRGVGYKLVNDG